MINDINELDNRGSVFVGIIHLGKLIKSLVGNGNNAYVGVDGAEGIVCRLGTRIGERVEECALSYVWESYDT